MAEEAALVEVGVVAEDDCKESSGTWGIDNSGLVTMIAMPILLGSAGSLMKQVVSEQGLTRFGGLMCGVYGGATATRLTTRSPV
jgi:hypothetical protein